MTTLHTSNSIARELHGQHWSSVRTYKRARQELLDTLEPNRSLQAAVKSQDNEFFVTRLKGVLQERRRHKWRLLQYRVDHWLGLYSLRSAFMVFLLLYCLPLMAFAGIVWLIAR